MFGGGPPILDAWACCFVSRAMAQAVAIPQGTSIPGAFLIAGRSRPACGAGAGHWRITGLLLSAQIGMLKTTSKAILFHAYKGSD